MFDKFWHKFMRRPYLLAKPIDQGAGQVVVLLHGIGRSGAVWQHVVSQLQDQPYRLVAFDLLGFGKSPKPAWLEYSVDEHARAVIASILQLKADGPVIIAGHSMGCLVSVRAACLRPDLVKHMVLYEMPLYEGLPEKRMYRVRLNIYKRLYDRIIKYQPTFDKETARLAERLAVRIAGFEIRRASWTAFVRSLQNTVLNQAAADDIKKLKVPIDVIYGRFDMLVIRGKPVEVFGSDIGSITAHTVRARHEISPRASRFIVDRIDAAQHPERQTAPKKKRILRRAQRAR